MLLLTQTTDSMQINTNTAAAVDVHASWVDTAGATITPGRKNTNIVAAATTSIVPAPAASTQRNVKTIHVRNKDATLSVAIRMQVVHAAGLVNIVDQTLNPGEMLEVVDMAGIKVYHV